MRHSPVRKPLFSRTRILIQVALYCLGGVWPLLGATAPGDTLFQDDFERAALGAAWSVDTSGGGSAGIGTHTSSSGTRSLFTRWNSVSVAAPVVDLNGKGATLSFWLRRGDDAFSEDPEVAGTEDLVLEFLDSSSSWVEVARYVAGDTPGEVFTPSFVISPDFLHAGFRFRFRQLGGNGVDWDYYHIDDVLLVETAPPTALVGGICDDFESGLANWMISGPGSNAGIGNQTANSPGNSLYLRWNTVTVTSQLLDLSALMGGSIQYWVRRGDDSFSEDPDNNEDLVVEYFNSSGTWIALDTFTGNGSPGQVFTRNYPLPVDARHAQFQLRFRYLQGSGPDFDYWHVDDVCAGPSSFPPPAALAYYVMDEAAWTGAAGEVADLSGNANHGQAIGSAATASVLPALVGDPGTCGYGEFPLNTSAAVRDAMDSSVDVNTIGNRGTVSFWYKSNQQWNGNRGDRMLFDASRDGPGGANSDKYFFLMLQNNSRLLFGLEDSNDNDFTLTTGNNNFAADTWVFVAVTWDLPADELQIFINGTLEAAQTFATNGALGELDTLYFGDNRSTYFAGGSSPNSANGSIDEVRIFSSALSQSQIQNLMAQTHACGQTLDHFTIDVGVGSASTCLPFAVTISARDAADAVIANYTGLVDLSTSSLHGTWSDPAGGINLNDPITDDGSAGLQFQLANGGSKMLNLANVHADDLTITVRDTSAGVSSVSPVVSFRDNLFVVTPTTCTGSTCPATGSLELVAGRDHDFHVEFWRRDALASPSCGIEPSYAGPKSLLISRLDDPDHPAAATAPSITGTPIGSATLTMSFNLGEADFTLATTDVGKFQIQLQDNTGFAVDSSGTQQPIVGGTGTVTVRPFGLSLENIVAGSTANPGATTPAGAVFTVAGGTFTADLRAVLWNATDDADGNGVPDATSDLSDNGTVPRFAWISGIDSGTASGTAFEPAAGVRGDITSGGAAVSVPVASFSGGVAAAPALAYSEVGSIVAAAAADNYLNSAGISVVGWSGPIGRFTPYDFGVSANVPAFATQCTGGAGAFSYLGAPFTYAPFLAPQWTVVARNMAGGTTLNYTGAWLKITAGSLSNKQYSAGTGTLDASGLPVNDPAITDLGSGQVQLDFSAGSGLRFQRGGPTDPFAADIELALEVRDADGVIYDPAQPANNGRYSVGGTTPGSGMLFDSGNTFRWGRMVLGNAFGPELLPLDLPLAIEYQENLAGVSAFVVNTDDGCSGLATSDLQLTGFSGNLNAGETAVTGVSLSSGSGAVTLSAPLVGNDGSVTASGLVPNVPDYLLFDWDGDGLHDNPPSGLATFGIYAGSDRLIFRREAF